MGYTPKTNAFLLLILISIFSYSDTKCPDINCDCENLPSNTWIQTCISQEKRLKMHCIKHQGLRSQYCSVHGPKANVLPLAIEIKDAAPVSVNTLPTIIDQVALIYWSFASDLEIMKDLMDQGKFAQSHELLSVINGNIENLFGMQLQIAASYKHTNDIAESRYTWREYAYDTFNFGNDLFLYAEELLKKLPESPYGERADTRVLNELIVFLYETSGKLFEYAGFSYASGIRHKQAAEAWKHASSASAMIIANYSDASFLKHNTQYYKFQSAARLHRASYHWILGAGRGKADASLRESQNYMKDSASLDALIDEEKEIKDSRPAWQK